MLTPSTFWTNLRREVNKLLDQDADVGVLLDERIRGLQEYRECMYEFENEPASEAASEPEPVAERPPGEQAVWGNG